MLQPLDRAVVLAEASVDGSDGDCLREAALAPREELVKYLARASDVTLFRKIVSQQPFCGVIGRRV